MRILKYNELSQKKVVSDINDIFVELRDIGYSVTIYNTYNRKQGYYYIIGIKNDNKLLNCSNIKDTFYMLCNYFDCNNVLYNYIDVNKFPDLSTLMHIKFYFHTNFFNFLII